MEIIIVILGLILDRVLKIWSLNYLQKVNEINVINNYFSLLFVKNKGAAFGIFQNKVIILSIVTSIVTLALIFYLIKYRPKNKLLRISLSLIISGAIGNLADRVYYGFVVDFISLHYKTAYYFAVFNIADSLVVIGTILLAIYILKEGK